MQTSLAPMAKLRSSSLTPFVVAAILFSFAALVAYWIMPFHITGTSPKTDSVSVSSPFFSISFNKQLATKGLSVSMYPNKMASYSVHKTVLTINFNQLTLDQKYTVVVRSIYSQGGSKVTNKQFSFTTKDIAVQNLSKDQQQAVLHRQDRYTGPNNDPIISHLPHGTLDYNLTPLITTDQSGKSVLVLQAALLVTQADINTDEQAAISQYKQEVRQYISSLGLNPDNYTIQYLLGGNEASDTNTNSLQTGD